MTNIKKCGIIIHDKNKTDVLLVYGKKSEKWGFPKGHMEDGESEEVTALRELREETGINWGKPLETRMRFRNNIYFIVFSDRFEIDPQISIQDQKEIEKVQWFSYQDIFQLPEYQCNFGLKNWIKRTKNIPVVENKV